MSATYEDVLSQECQLQCRTHSSMNLFDMYMESADVAESKRNQYVISVVKNTN